MRVVTLSNHTAEQLQQREAERKRRDHEVSRIYVARLDEYQAAASKYQMGLAQAWRDWRLGVVISHALRLLWLTLRGAPKPPRPKAADQRDRALLAGLEGEEAVVEVLSQSLGDEYLLIRGYRNLKGEIDDILIAPRGLIGFEVKNHNGHFRCEGDRWFKDKYDRYGNLVEPNQPVEDRNGRSPSEQLNQATDVLQAFLLSRGITAPIRRVIVLSHKRSSIGYLERPTVDRTVRLADGGLLGVTREFTAESGVRNVDVEGVLRLIEQHHKDYSQRRTHRHKPDVR